MNPSSVTSNLSSIPPSGDLSNSQVIDPGQTCVHCGDPAGYSPQNHQKPDFPNASLLCQSCGNRNTDSLSFYVVDKETNLRFSPEFSTLDEAKQFADIFGMTSYGNYGYRGTTYLFKGGRDESARREYLARIAFGRQLLTLLLELRSSCPDADSFISLALSIFNSLLELSKEQNTAGRVE